MVAGVNTLATSPVSLCNRTRLPSLTAIPAASCPRCCNANNPKNTVWARPSPCGVDTPNTPHSSCGASEREMVTGVRSGSMPENLPDAIVDRIATGFEGHPGQAFIGVDVATRRGLPHRGLELRRDAVTVVAGVDHRAPNHFLVETLRFLAGVQPLLVRGGHPVARRVRSVYLVDQHQAAGSTGSELVFRVGQDEAGGASELLPASEQFECGGLDFAPQRWGDEAFTRDITGAQWLVVTTVIGLGGRCDDGRWQVGVL